MKEALRAKLLADSGVSALVGTRVAWSLLPRGAVLPAIALHLVSGVRDYSMSAPTGLVTSRVQVDCWAVSAAGASALSSAVNAALSGIRETVDGVQFQGAFIENETDFVDDTSAPPDELLYRCSLDFLIWHSE